MTPTEKLADLNLTLPRVTAPVGSYVPAKRIADLIYTSGQIPIAGGKVTVTGKVGEDVTLAQAQEAAKLCALNALAAVASVTGSLDRIVAIERVCVYVASAPAFAQQPQVANAASDLFFALFGEAGKHVRSAVGVSVLPLDVPVELELIAREGA
jgi:enamine deaminase RidA (YjgF/YER057c/UK114 family)